jgi:hypothetical protein
LERVDRVVVTGRVDEVAAIFPTFQRRHE